MKRFKLIGLMPLLAGELPKLAELVNKTRKFPNLVPVGHGPLDHDVR